VTEATKPATAKWSSPEELHSSRPTHTRRHRVPRPPPPPIDPADFERLRRLLETAEWIFAKSQPRNPHCYSLRRKWASDEDFVWCVETIRTHGVREKFKKSWYVTFTIGAYFFFSMGWPVNTRDGKPLTILINKKAVALRGVEPPRLVKRARHE
jgi:hypothetical protein